MAKIKYNQIEPINLLDNKSFPKAEDLFLIEDSEDSFGVKNVKVGDLNLGNISTSADTQKINLGDITGTDIEDAFNAFDFQGVEIQDQIEGARIINTIQSGENVDYLFTGSAGLYGSEPSATETAIDEDFSEFDTDQFIPNLFNVSGSRFSNTGIPATQYNQNIIHGGSIKSTSLIVDDANDGGVITNRRFGNLRIRGYTDLILEGTNPNNSEVVVTSNGPINAYDQDRFRYNLKVSRDYGSAVPYSGARKTLVGLGIADTVRMTDATNSSSMDYAALYINPNLVSGTETNKIISIFSEVGNVEINNGKIKFGSYGQGSITGTETYLAAFDTDGNLIEVDPSGLGGGSGSTDYVSNVILNGTDLEYTGIGNAFNSSVDLSSLVGISYTDEEAQDAIAAAIAAGTTTRIAIAYDDANNLFNFTVDDDLSNYDNSTTLFLQENTVVAAIDSSLGQTDWKSIPTEEQVLGTAISLDNSDISGGDITLDCETFSSAKIELGANNANLVLSNVPSSGFTQAKNIHYSTSGAGNLAIDAGWKQIGEDLDHTAENIITLETVYFPGDAGNTVVWANSVVQ